MKNKFLLLLALLTQGLSFAQTTGTSYEPIRWDKGSTAVYGRVLRDYSVYPDPAANSAFYSAISAGSLEVKPRVGPSWLSARITYLQSQKYLEVEATGANNVQMKFERVDGSAMTGANPDGVNLSSGQFYYPGQISVGGYTKIWTFGKTSNGIGGIDLVPIKLTFKNVDTGETYVHSFTPINKASRAQLFVAANSSPPVTTPTWVSARYTYAASTAQLAIESAGEAMQLKFERVDGLAMVGSNPDGVSLSSGIYYGNGPLTGQGSYDKQWTFGKKSDGSGGVPTVPIRLTFKRNSDNSTFSFVFTPATVTRQQLFLAGSGGGGTTITYRPISKVLVAANSIGYYEGNGYGSWGLAASAENKDFFHILRDSIRTIYPGADVRLWGGFSGVSIAEGGYFEANYDNLSNGLSRYDAMAGFAPDVFIVRLGENVVPPIRSTFSSSWVSMINKVTSLSSSPIKILSTSSWGNTTVDNALIGLASANNYPLIDLRNITGAQAGALNHPNDAAMLTIANRSWAVLKASLQTTTSTPVASCNFDITTAGQTVGCGAGVTLSAAITGADASGVSITWTGNGINQLGQSVGINAPTTNGTYAYVATASKNGCSNKTATASVTVSGCTSSGTNPTATAYYSKGFGEGSYEQLLQSAPFTPSVNQYSSWPTGNTTQYLDNGIIRFGIGRAIGGAIKHLGLSNGGKNWVNTFAGGETAGYFEGEYSPDTGRSGGWSMYGTPGHNFNDGGQSTSVYYDTGWNPVHGGSIYGDRSPISWFERRTVPGYGEVMYCRTQPYMWALHGILAKITYHCWWWLEGNTVRYFSIHENFRDDNQMVYRAREQEGPFMYTTADLWHHYVHTGNNPGTGEGLTDISSPPVFEGGQGGIAEHFSQNFNSGEGWVASVDDNQNGIIMIPQHNARFKGGQFQARGGDEFTNASSYINSAMLFNEDVRSTVAFGGYFYAGNLNSFRQWYNSRTIERPDFSWNFGTNNTCGWWSLDAPARFVNNRYSFQVGLRSNDPNAPNPNDYQAKGYFNSPSGVWKASDISNIYIKAAFPANCTNWTIYWKKPGNDNNQEYSKDFTSSPTSNVQTVTIPMQGTGNWNGIISSIRIKLRDSSQSTNGNEELVPTYIGNVAPNAIADWQTLIGLSILAGTTLRKRRHALGVRTKKPVQRLRKGAVLASLLLASTLFSCEQATQRIEPVAKSVVSPASGAFEGEYSPDSNRPGGWSMYGTSDSTKLIKLVNCDTGWNWPTGSYAQKLKARP